MRQLTRFRRNGKTWYASDFVKQTQSFCAAASVANVCRVVEHTYKDAPLTETIAALVMGLKTDALEKGADERAIKGGLVKLGFKTRARKPTTRVVRWWQGDKWDAAMEFLAAHALIASVDGQNHWAVMVMDDAGKPVVIDSDNTAPMIARPSLTELERRWRTNGVMYAIGVR